MLRINARPGQRSNRSEAISVARFHSIPPTLYGLGNWERGSRISSSSITDRWTKGRTTAVGACQQKGLGIRVLWEIHSASTARTVSLERFRLVGITSGEKLVHYQSYSISIGSYVTSSVVNPISLLLLLMTVGIQLPWPDHKALLRTSAKPMF